MEKLIASCGLDCAECDDYVCDKLGELFKMAPEAEQNLEQLRR